MNNSSHNLTGLLTSWGKSQAQMPANGSVLKNEMLNHLPHNSQPTMAKTNFKTQWLPLAFSGLAALALVIQLTSTNTVSHFSSKITSNISAPAGSPAVHEEAGNKDSGLSRSDNYLQSAAPSAAQDSYGQFDESSNYKARDIYKSPVQPQGEIPATDDRELLKIDYSANIQSHNVMDLASRLQTTVKVYDGRIDNSVSSANSGYINFVLPAAKFETFKQEVKNIAGKRFVIENVQTQNMLPEKRSIESQQKSVQDQLDETTKQKTQLTEAHNQTVASLQSQINAASKQLSDLQNQHPDNLQQQVQIETQKQEVSAKIKTLQSRLANENSNYQNQLNYFDYQIKNLQSALENVKTQDTNLQDSVATVRGSISFSYISRWEIFNTYLGGGGWLAIFLGLLAIISYFATRMNKLIIP